MKIWLPLLTFPKVKAPHFPKGYISSVAFEFIMWVILIGDSLHMEAMEKATSSFWDSAGRRESVMVSAIITGEKNYTQEQVRSQTESWDFEDDITLQASNGNANGGRDGKWRNCDVFSNLTDNGRKLYNQTRRNDLSIWAIFLRSFYIFCSAQLLLVRLGGFEDL